MRGMKSEDLVAIIDFLYCGEANMVETNLGNFLNIADELNLLGLNKEGSERGKSLKLPEKNTIQKPDTKKGNTENEIPPQPYIQPRSNINIPYQNKAGKKVSLDGGVRILGDIEDKMVHASQPECVEKEIQYIIQKHTRKMRQQVINESNCSKSNISKNQNVTH